MHAKCCCHDGDGIGVKVMTKMIFCHFPCTRPAGPGRQRVSCSVTSGLFPLYLRITVDKFHLTDALYLLPIMANIKKLAKCVLGAEDRQGRVSTSESLLWKTRAFLHKQFDLACHVFFHVMNVRHHIYETWLKVVSGLWVSSPTCSTIPRNDNVSCNEQVDKNDASIPFYPLFLGLLSQGYRRPLYAHESKGSRMKLGRWNFICIFWAYECKLLANYQRMFINKMQRVRQQQSFNNAHLLGQLTIIPCKTWIRQCEWRPMASGYWKFAVLCHSGTCLDVFDQKEESRT